MDIEERARKWAERYVTRELEIKSSSLSKFIRSVAITAYMAGAAQTQRDYESYYGGKPRWMSHGGPMSDDFHDYLS